MSEISGHLPQTAPDADAADRAVGLAWRAGRREEAARLIEVARTLDPSRSRLWDARAARINGPSAQPQAAPAEWRKGYLGYSPEDWRRQQAILGQSPPPRTVTIAGRTHPAFTCRGCGHDGPDRTALNLGGYHAACAPVAPEPDTAAPEQLTLADDRGLEAG